VRVLHSHDGGRRWPPLPLPGALTFLTLTFRARSALSLSRDRADALSPLPRAQTCPTALCEDCLPDGFEEVGDALPELLMLGFAAQRQAFFIKCGECVEYYRENPKQAAAQKAAEVRAEKKAAKMGYSW